VEVFDVRLSGGTVVTAGGAQQIDVLVRDGVIAALAAPGAPAQARDEIDCSGRHILPGAVDPHVHLGPNITYPQDPGRDALPESQAAAAGGVTTMLAYLLSPLPYDEIFPTAVETMRQGSVVDFGFHLCVVSREQLAALQTYVNQLGVSSFKFFMNFRGDEGSYLGLPGNDDGFLFDLLEAAAGCGAMINPHAENIELVWRIRNAGVPTGKTDLETWYNSRPDYVEAEALGKVAYLAQVTGASAYAVHASSAAAMRVLERARDNYDNMFVETCPHYLTLDTDSPCGTYGKVNPPVRRPDDRDPLWEALARGVVDTVGSDHVPRHRSFKEKDVAPASAGFPGLQTLLPLLLSEGHLKRQVPLERIVEVTATRPAQLFGLYPRKGEIRVGADADLVVVDLSTPDQITSDRQFSGAAYTPWDGWQLDCRVEQTLVRGSTVYLHGEAASTPQGEYLSRPASGAAALARMSQGAQR
jgi:dihydropyrimidinase